MTKTQLKEDKKILKFLNNNYLDDTVTLHLDTFLKKILALDFFPIHKISYKYSPLMQGEMSQSSQISWEFGLSVVYGKSNLLFSPKTTHIKLKNKYTRKNRQKCSTRLRSHFQACTRPVLQHGHFSLITPVSRQFLRNCTPVTRQFLRNC